MADNYVTNPGAGGVTFAGDEDGALVQWPLIKLAWGQLDVFNILADATGKRLPVNLGEIGGTALTAGQKTMAGSIPVVVASDQASVRVDLTTVAFTDLDAVAVVPFGTAPAAGHVQGVNASLFSGLVSLTNTAGALDVNLKTSAASVAVTGPLTDVQLRASAVPVSVSGNVEVTNDVGNPLPVSGTVAVSNFPASVEVSNDAGNPLPVSGTVGVNNFPATQNVNVTNASLAVTGSLSIAPSGLPTVIEDNLAQYNDNGALYVAPDPETDPPTGSLQAQIAALLQSARPPTQLAAISGALSATTGATSFVGPLALNGAARVAVLFQGTYTGLNVTTEVSNDPTFVTWHGVRSVRQASTFMEIGSNFAVANSATQANLIDCSGWLYFRVRCTAITSGMASVTLVPSLPAAAPIANAIASGTSGEAAAATSNPVRVGGWDGTLMRTFLTDVNGQLVVNQGAAGAASWPVSVPAGVVVTSSALPTNAPAENAGVLQRIADLLEQILMETRINGIVLASLDGTPEDPDSVRATLSLTTLN